MHKNFFSANRKKLIEKLKGGALVLSAYNSQQRSNDGAHAFIQESNFWYLTGIDEPDWALVIDGTRGHSWLIAPTVSEVRRIFDGGLSNEQALAISGVDEVIAAETISTVLKQLTRTHKLAYTVGSPQYSDHFNFEPNPAPERTRQLLLRHFMTVEDCRKELSQMRAIKQPEELAAIDKAISVSISAFKNIRSNIKNYKYEYEIEADFSRDIRFKGAQGCAYESIVAGGINACTLHYSKNTEKLGNRKLVLMDMGAQYGGYAADITRTYAKGEPTKRQQQVHKAVEEAHYKIISLLGPMVAVETYQQDVDKIMTEAMVSIGFGSDIETLRRYMPHAISHGLGIDVHDSLGGPKYFKENMVLTVEPGIYIPEEGIGVRIEDDILVTATGRKNLSASLSTGL